MKTSICHIQTHNMPVIINFSQVGGGGGGGSIPDERKASSATQIFARTALVNTTTYYGEITNHYTWQGRKLGKSLRNSQGTLTLDETYYDELMLNFGKPGRISHADGYVSLDENGNTTFYYYLKDHLGNVRSVITPDSDGKPLVVQANDYFPFGMSFESPIPHLSYKSTTTNKHKYNGKEEQEMPGKWLDYGRRFYDPSIARFTTVDPWTEKYTFQSPYAYATNNPIIFIDYMGLGPWDKVKGAAGIVGGGAQWVTGVGLAATGAGALPGALLIMSGSASISWGVATLVNDGKKDVPLGTAQAMGRVRDNYTGDENRTSEKVGTLIDFAIGLPGGNLNGAAKAADRAATTVQAAGAIETIINMSSKGNIGDATTENQNSSTATTEGQGQNMESSSIDINPTIPTNVSETVRTSVNRQICVQKIDDGNNQ